MYYSIQSYKGITITLVGNNEGLQQLLVDNEYHQTIISKEWKLNNEMFNEAHQQLKEYLNGQRTKFELQLNPIGTAFQKQVWQQLSKIPYANLATYKQIATAMGNPKAARAIGMANNKNPLPIIVPCHRVVGQGQKMVGYVFGVDLKQRLIRNEKINLIFSRLSQYYGNISRAHRANGASWWPGHSAFEVMVGAILTQNTNWKNVEKALNNFNGKLSPQFIKHESLEKLSSIIRPSGYHNQKAQKLKNMVEWFHSYQFDADNTKSKSTAELRSELLNIKGIGAETADSILVYALCRPSFVIDTYTRRILSRTGIDLPPNYDQLRLMIEDAIAPNLDTYDHYHGLIVEHAKAFCTKTPQCAECPLASVCAKRLVLEIS